MNMKWKLGLASCLFAFAAATASGQAASSICKDGTTSATSGRGACSGHGGVDAKATEAAKKAAKPAAKSTTKKTEKPAAKTAEKPAAKVTCSDGTSSAGGQGACSGHGGIAKAAARPTKTAPAPSLPASVAANSPARTNSSAKSKAPSATTTAPSKRADTDPTDALAQCKDGTYSHASSRQGACSKHGGVSKWLKP